MTSKADLGRLRRVPLRDCWQREDSDFTPWLAQEDIPYDVVMDRHVTPGALSAYKAVIFPMAKYVSERVHGELLAAARAGTRIIVDRHCAQDYPGAERWNQGYFHRLPVAEREDYGAVTRQRLARLRDELPLYGRSKGQQGPVLTNVRADGRVRYVAVLNNHRQAGTYTEWTGQPDFRPLPLLTG